MKNKHPGTFPFHPGNDIPEPRNKSSEVVTMPAYNSAGREYKRILPPMRDPKQIDTRLLALLINKKTNGNFAEITPTGITLNKNSIHLSEGLASCKEVKFRFTDIWDLLLELKKERILIAEMQDLRTIRKEYHENL